MAGFFCWKHARALLQDRRDAAEQQIWYQKQKKMDAW